MDNLVERLDKMDAHIPVYAKAKANRVYLEHFRHSKRAILMRECFEKTATAKEVFALSHPEYTQLLMGIKEAIEVEEKARWSLEKLKMDVQIWQTTQANERYLQNKV